MYTKNRSLTQLGVPIDFKTCNAAVFSFSKTQHYNIILWIKYVNNELYLTTFLHWTIQLCFWVTIVILILVGGFNFPYVFLFLRFHGLYYHFDDMGAISQGPLALIPISHERCALLIHNNIYYNYIITCQCESWIVNESHSNHSPITIDGIIDARM